MAEPSGPCAKFWASVKSAIDALPSLQPPQSGGGASLGHEDGADDDLVTGSSDAQQSTQAANDAGGDTQVGETTGTCPLCKVAIVVGHNSSAQGAYSAHVGESEYPYNTDIANRTVAKIAELSGGKVSAKVFFRTPGGGYTTEMRRCYEPVTTYLDGVPSNKKIAIELHYNSVTDTSARYAMTIFKGDRAFAVSATTAMAKIYGTTREIVKSYTDNARGRATFTYGPSNTYLMEPFFGSHKSSAEHAATETGKDALAQVYADLLVEWVG